MRIFLSMSPSGNANVPESKTWLHNLYEPLLDLGHDVFLVNIDKAARYLNVDRRSTSFKDKFSNYVLKIFKDENKNNQFDLFLSYFTDNTIYPDVIDEIKRESVPTANFSCNNTHQFYLVGKISPHYDFNLHSEKHARGKFKRINANPVWFQMAANPKYYHPITTNEIYDVTFVGSNYAKRSNYIWHLLENGINVDCFGPNWLLNKPMPFLRNIIKESKRNYHVLKTLVSFSSTKRNKYSSIIALYDFNRHLRKKYKNRFHYPVPDELMIKIYSQSKINLGFLEVFDNHNPSLIVKQHLHLREFEVPMCGALYFTNYCDELSEFYEPDKEIVIYRNQHELFDKVNYYLSNPAQAEKVRKRGYERAVKCHSYQKRFQDLFDKISLK